MSVTWHEFLPTCLHVFIFLLSLVFRSLVTVCLGIYFFRFIILGIRLLSWLCRLSVSVANFRKFSAIHYWILFLHHFLSFGNPVTQGFYLLLLSHRSLRLCSCVLSLYCYRHSIDPSPSWVILFSAINSTLLIPSSKFCYCFSITCFSYSCFNFYFFTENFSLFVFVSRSSVMLV